MKRRAEEAVSDVKRQAVVELQKAVRAAEEKANEAVGQTQSKVDKAVMEARRQAIEETLGMINRQSDSSEVSQTNFSYATTVIDRNKRTKARTNHFIDIKYNNENK